MFQVPPSEHAKPGTIAQVLSKGFTFKDRVLRPAQVGAVSDE
jgi:molecular chaperone GrpE (heat shock protein)